jgi:hypothetical protein
MPPAQAMVTSTRSLSPSTVTRSMTWRMSCLRSALVVVGASHSAGMSAASRRMAARWSADRVRGWVVVDRR